MASLVFKTKIKGETLRYKKLKNFDGKKVNVVITETDTKNEKKWLTLASIDLGGILDHKNVRDFAYE